MSDTGLPEVDLHKNNEKRSKGTPRKLFPPKATIWGSTGNCVNFQTIK